MRSHFLLTVSFSICLLLAVPRSLVPGPAGNCDLPAGLGDELAKIFPTLYIITLADLGGHEKDLLQRGRGSQCPGQAPADVYSDGKPTWALVLISGDGPKRIAEFVVARRISDDWEFRLLDKARGTAVVWSEPPGTYANMWARPVTWAVKDVVIVWLVDPPGPAIAYAWVGNKIETAVKILR